MRRQTATPGLLFALLATGCGSGGLVGANAEAQLASRSALVGNYTGGLVNYAAYAFLRIGIASDGSVTGVVDTGEGQLRYLAGGLDGQHRLLVEDSALAIGGEFRGAIHPEDSSLYVTQGVHFVGAWTEGGSGGTVDAWHSSWPPPLGSLHSHTNWWGSFANGLVGFLVDTGVDYLDSYDSYSSYQSSNPSSASSNSGSSSGSSTASTANDPPEGGGDPLTDEVVVRER